MSASGSLGSRSSRSGCRLVVLCSLLICGCGKAWQRAKKRVGSWRQRRRPAQHHAHHQRPGGRAEAERDAARQRDGYETGEQPQAELVITVGDQEIKTASAGNGPVDASLKAIEAHVKSGAEMVLYSVNAISGNTESQGEVTVRLQSGGRVVNGVGADPDIVVASAKAYLSALSKLHCPEERVAAQGV